MSRDTLSGKKGKGPRTKRKSDLPPETEKPTDAQPTRMQRSKTYARSVLHKGTHDTLATFVKGGLITLVCALVSWGGLRYFGYEIDVRAWLSGKSTGIETGSIKKTPAPATADPDAVKKEVECRVKQVRDIDRLIDRRKLAWGVFDRCRAEWKADQKQTAEEGCAPNLVAYRQASQEVKDRQAKDECSASSWK